MDRILFKINYIENGPSYLTLKLGDYERKCTALDRTDEFNNRIHYKYYSCHEMIYFLDEWLDYFNANGFYYPHLKEVFTEFSKEQFLDRVKPNDILIALEDDFRYYRFKNYNKHTFEEDIYFQDLKYIKFNFIIYDSDDKVVFDGTVKADNVREAKKYKEMLIINGIDSKILGYKHPQFMTVLLDNGNKELLEQVADILNKNITEYFDDKNNFYIELADNLRISY